MEATLQRPLVRPPGRRAAAPSPGGFRLGRVAGIELRAHASWLIIAVLIVLSLEAEFALSHPELLPARRWAAAAVAAALFFGSILVHELSHSLVAKGKGIGVQGITLFVFGGVSRLKGEARRPGDEFLIAIVGPLTSALLGAAFLGLQRLLTGGSVEAGVAQWLGRTNLALALFNLLPGFPLDGGRVFRAIAWRATGDLRKATRWAAGAGMTVAHLLIASGIFLAFALGWLGDGFWMALLGFFLLSAARTSLPQFDLHEMLGRLRAADAMDVSLAFVPPEEPVGVLVEERVLRGRKESFAVEDEGGVLGFVTLPDLLAAGAGSGSEMTVAEIMVPLVGSEGVPPEMPLLEVLERMDDLGVDRLPVVEAGVLRGILSRADVLRRTALYLQLGAGP